MDYLLISIRTGAHSWSSGRARRWLRRLPAGIPPLLWWSRRPISSPQWPRCCAASSPVCGGSAGGLLRRWAAPPRWPRRRPATSLPLLPRWRAMPPPWPRRPMPCAPAPSSMRCSARPGASQSGCFRRRAGPARKNGHRVVPGPPVRHDARHGSARRVHRAA
jgi:hypothetical protein